MQIVYVETCPLCSCPVVCSGSGERRACDHFQAECAGCSCHENPPLSAGSRAG